MSQILQECSIGKRDKIWDTGFLKGGFYIGGRIPGYDYEALGRSILSATTDGGIAVAGRTSLRGAGVTEKIAANGAPRPWQESDIFSFSSETTIDDIIGTPDGGFLVLYTSIQTNAPTNATIRKYDAAGNFSWIKQLAYPVNNPASPDLSLTKGESIINTPDGGFLIVGYYNNTGIIKNLANNNAKTETGWIAKLDGQGNVSWQKLLDNLSIWGNNIGIVAGSISEISAATDVILAADGNGYAITGAGIPSGPGTVPTPVTSILELDSDGLFKRARSLGVAASKAFITVYTSPDNTKYYMVGVTARYNGADPHLLKVSTAPLSGVDPHLLQVVGERVFDGPSDGFLTGLGIAGDGSLVFSSSAGQVVKLVREVAPPSGGSLVLTQPTYNCQTGAITFNVTGGDGSTITYSAPGISRASATSNTGTIEQGLRNDPKPITITATQSGQTATYTFDFGAFCNGTQPPQPPQPPTGGAFTLVAPTYDCATGAIRFNTSGGNGSLIEYAAAGITGWTTNPNQFVDRDSRTANDVQPFTLMARQSGVTVTYVWNLKAACGRARLVSMEIGPTMQVRVLGNPVEGKTVNVEISGVSDQAVQVDLIDLQGRLVHQHHIGQAASTEQISLPTGNSKGILLLTVSTASQRQQIKLLKP